MGIKDNNLGWYGSAIHRINQRVKHGFNKELT